MVATCVVSARSSAGSVVQSGSPGAAYGTPSVSFDPHSTGTSARAAMLRAQRGGRWRAPVLYRPAERESPAGAAAPGPPAPAERAATMRSYGSAASASTGVARGPTAATASPPLPRPLAAECGDGRVGRVAMISRDETGRAPTACRAACRSCHRRRPGRRPSRCRDRRRTGPRVRAPTRAPADVQHAQVGHPPTLDAASGQRQEPERAEAVVDGHDYGAPRRASVAPSRRASARAGPKPPPCSHTITGRRAPSVPASRR